MLFIHIVFNTTHAQLMPSVCDCLGNIQISTFYKNLPLTFGAQETRYWISEISQQKKDKNGFTASL